MKEIEIGSLTIWPPDHEGDVEIEIDTDWTPAGGFINILKLKEWVDYHAKNLQPIEGR